ncbi:MAG: hypothetical protein EOO38_09230 [Cytophagaceae bacterium]|nr:MAG: hypothetical protein EOO38_09230 [Cytophagaceae bacterium]
MGVVTYRDREEGTVTTGSASNPSPPTPIVLRPCGATSVVSFNATAAQSVLGAQIARTTFDTGATTPDGWMEIGMPGSNAIGLPLLGKSFMRATNPNAGPGISANFGLSFEHRYAPTRH